MDQGILDKASKLIENISLISENIKDAEIHDISFRLRLVADSVFPSLEAGYRGNKRSDRIKSKIRALGYLEECRDYLKIVDKFRYADTGNLIEEIDQIKNMLGEDGFAGAQFVSSN